MEGRMTAAEAEGFLKQGFTGFHAVPWGSAGGMGQRNEVRLETVVSDPELAPNDLVELLGRHELVDGKAAHAEDEFGMEDLEFVFEPARAVGNLVIIGHAITAGGFFTGKTAADGGHVNASSELILREAAVFLEPSEKGLAGGPGERASQNRFLVAGGLSDEDDLAGHRAAAHDRFMHLGAKLTGTQFFDVALKFPEDG